jgi:alcohol dehydrogenase
MRGVVFNGPRNVQVETVPDATIVEPTDALVRVTKGSICGSDLHIFNNGESFGFTDGCRLGHEFCGVVETVGADVRKVRVGQKVLAPFWISCGHCAFWRAELYTSCIAGGCFGFQPFWAGGGHVEGGQSEYVRAPLADGTLEPIPEALAEDEHDTKVLPLADVFCTAYHAVTGAGLTPGDTVLVIGDGAVGLLACQAAGLFGAANVVLAGHHDDRLALGTRLGATHQVNTAGGNGLADLLTDLTDGRGPAAVIDCISSAQSMRSACQTVRPGGTVSWVGMEVFLGAPDVPWDLAFLRNLTVRGGVCPSRRYIRHLWPLLEAGRIDPSPVFTHDLPLAQAASGYQIMATRETGSVKVAVTP